MWHPQVGSGYSPATAFSNGPFPPSVGASIPPLPPPPSQHTFPNPPLVPPGAVPFHPYPNGPVFRFDSTSAPHQPVFSFDGDSSDHSDRMDIDRPEPSTRLPRSQPVPRVHLPLGSFVPTVFNFVEPSYDPRTEVTDRAPSSSEFLDRILGDETEADLSRPVPVFRDPNEIDPEADYSGPGFDSLEPPSLSRTRSRKRKRATEAAETLIERPHKQRRRDTFERQSHPTFPLLRPHSTRHRLSTSQEVVLHDRIRSDTYRMLRLLPPEVKRHLRTLLVRHGTVGCVFWQKMTGRLLVCWTRPSEMRVVLEQERMDLLRGTDGDGPNSIPVGLCDEWSCFLVVDEEDWTGIHHHRDPLPRGTAEGFIRYPIIQQQQQQTTSSSSLVLPLSTQSHTNPQHVGMMTGSSSASPINRNVWNSFLELIGQLDRRFTVYLYSLVARVVRRVGGQENDQVRVDFEVSSQQRIVLDDNEYRRRFEREQSGRFEDLDEVEARQRDDWREMEEDNDMEMEGEGEVEDEVQDEAMDVDVREEASGVIPRVLDPTNVPPPMDYLPTPLDYRVRQLRRGKKRSRQEAFASERTFGSYPSEEDYSQQEMNRELKRRRISEEREEMARVESELGMGARQPSGVFWSQRWGNGAFQWTPQQGGVDEDGDVRFAS